MQGRRQQGSILVIVMLVMMIGLLMLGGLQRQLDIQLQQGIDEQRFWQAFNQGLSSLNWGMGLRWQTTGEWQCQAQQSAQLRACLRISGEDHSGLLRGEGRIAGNPQPLAFYHRVMAAAASGPSRADGWIFARMRRSRPVSRRNERSRREPCAGFSLPETLVAALLFAVSLVGLLQYHQVLQQSLLHQMQQRQAWRLAHQQLETEGADSVSSSSRSVPAGWRVSREEQRHPPACRRVTVTVVTPYRYRAMLGRWFCDTPDAVVQRDSP